MHLLAARLRQLAAAAEALAPLIDSEQSGPPRAVGSLPVARSLPAAVADPPPAGGRGAKQRAVAEFLAANSNAEIEEIQAAIGCSRSTASAARKNFLEGDGSKKSN
jgi:hypothetical protein